MKHSFAGLVIIAMAGPAVAELPDGHWRVSQHLSPLAEQRLCVLKVEKKDGKSTATVTDSLKAFAPRGEEPKAIDVKVNEFTMDGDKVTLALTVGVQKLTFEGTVDAKDKKSLRGAIDDGRRVSRGMLTMQDGEKLEPLTAADRPKAPEPYLAAQKLNTAAMQLQFRAQQAKDPNDRAELMAEIKKAQAEAQEKVPPLLKETVEKHADTPHAIDAATQLLRSAARTKATAQDVAGWVKVIDADAAKYGPKFAREQAVLSAEMLNAQKGYETVALAAATRGAEGLTDKAPLAVQARVLTILKKTQTASGKSDEAKATEERLVALEPLLDAEYVKTVPPFKPEKFAGRKEKGANRVAVMELFTGATCPPCVAADAAFDALEKTYDAKDLILIQYHMHIPGPDPLTNPDTIARWDYYRAKFPEGIRGVPSSIFNGKPEAGGGGGMANAEPKYVDYRKIIDRFLENSTDLKVTGSAKRAGDKISVSVDLSGVPEPGENLKLRVLLLEEKVKYVGSNGMRFHHRVVRAMPGGAGGTAVTDKAMQKTIDLDVAAVKKDLAAYLEKFAADRPFANPARPLDLAHLSVVAFVQNDATGEILNAAEIPVEGK